MKNILSSLNESEKKRILEMHYRASNRHYLMEQTPKAKTSTKDFKTNIANIISKYNKSDYFDLSELAAAGASTQENPVLHITVKSNAANIFTQVGSNTNSIYSCKTGWGIEGAANPFETFKLEYKQSNTNGVDNGKTPANIAQNFVNSVCSELGFKTPGSSATSKAATSTASVQKTLTPPEVGLDYQESGSMFSVSLDTERSTQGDEIVEISMNNCTNDKSASDIFVMKLDDGRELTIPCRQGVKYSCKYNRWASSENPTVPTSQWLDTMTPGFGQSKMVATKNATPKGYAFPELGRTPDEVALKNVQYYCKNLSWK